MPKLQPALLTIATMVVLSVPACSGGGQSAAPLAPSAPQAAALPAAAAQGCVYPSTLLQTVALPAAGGVTGTITIGAVAQSSSTCSPVQVMTGSDATLALQTTHRRVATVQSGTPVPLLQVELTNTYTGQLNWFGISLQFAPGQVPAGKYPATITTVIDLGDGTTTTSTTNFTVTVAANGQAIITAPSGSSVFAPLTANTSGLLSIYPAGTTLPTPAPSPSPAPSAGPSSTPTPSATPSPSGSPTGTPTPVATPTPTPNPSDPPGAIYGHVMLSPTGCVNAGTGPSVVTFTASTRSSPPTGYVWEYGWFGSFGQMTLNVPQPYTYTQNFSGTVRLTANGTVTLNVPQYPVGSLSGEGADVAVSLFAVDMYGLSQQAYDDSTANHLAYTYTVVDAGSLSCP